MKMVCVLSLILSTFSYTPQVVAQEITLPKIESPSVLNEGIQRELTATQIAELLPWAKDSKIFIIDLIDHASSLPMEQKLERLIEGTKQIVSESAPKHSELLMRYSLNRALVVANILDQELDSSSVGSIDAKSRVLIESLKMSLRYYESDMRTLSTKAPTPFAQFGIEYFQFLTELNKSIFDASAQYNVQRLAFEFLQWDMYRDLNNTSYAPQIVKINNALKIFPLKKMPDAHAINYIRHMRKTIEQLDMKLIAKSSQDSTSIFNKIEPKVEEGKKGKFKTYNGQCYAIDNAGNYLWDAGKQNWRNCHQGSYGTYNGACYAKDSAGNFIWDAGKESWSNCHSGNYKTYNGACYPVDRSGNFLWDAGKVTYTKCQ